MAPSSRRCRGGDYPVAPSRETCRSALTASSTVGSTGTTSERWTRAITRAVGLDVGHGERDARPALAGEAGETEQAVEPGAVDERDPVEVDDELSGGDEPIEPRSGLVDRELVQLARDADDRDAADLVSCQLYSSHASSAARA